LTGLREKGRPGWERSVEPRNWLVQGVRRLLLAVPLIAFLLPASALAATITPNTTLDETVAGGTCSLREAVKSANTNADFGGCTHSGTYGADTIELGANDYELSLPGSENSNATGDLDVTDSLTIHGVGADQTGIDGNRAITNDRVIDLFSTLTVSAVTIHGGGNSGDDGGGVLVETGNTITLNSSVVSGNVAGGGSPSRGGGIFSSAPSISTTAR
jgi:CSLREA domain-containing protein